MASSAAPVAFTSCIGGDVPEGEEQRGRHRQHPAHPPRGAALILKETNGHALSYGGVSVVSMLLSLLVWPTYGSSCGAFFGPHLKRIRVAAHLHLGRRTFVAAASWYASPDRVVTGSPTRRFADATLASLPRSSASCGMSTDLVETSFSAIFLFIPGSASSSLLFLSSISRPFADT
ncbi:hypothetical protein B0H17DRAFT_1216521 [Mycena rosella]|uniref:Uncharacterized protein n=1 Tax=Mycena rosella TaxID=1033263 RepID=A0AAD7C6R8_MYCRO|nr:hypothetical protein B0H17DRAFT_1216521 [Mycena rosella]